VSASPNDQQPAALSRREAFQDWGRGLGRLICDLLGLEDPDARLRRTLSQIPEMSDQQLQELAQPAMALRQTRLYAAANLEQLSRLQRCDQESLRRAELEWQQRWGLGE
jgi:hypothetical protein